MFKTKKNPSLLPDYQQFYHGGKPPIEAMSEGKKLPQYVAALSVCMGAVAAGTLIGWTATIGQDLQNGKLNDIRMANEELSWIGSFMTLGAMCVCIPIGKICDWFGRKITMLALIIPFLVGWLLVIIGESIEVLYAGRFISGVAGGAFCVSAPMYTSEIAQKEVRGALGSYFQLLLTVGILLANILGYSLSILAYNIICACIPILFGVVFFLQPETPVYLMKKDRVKDAKASLRKLRGSSYDVDKEIEEIREALAKEEREKMPFVESFQKLSTKKAMVICYGLMFFQQFSGVNAVVFYTSTIFKDAGVSIDAGIATMLVSICQVVSTFVSTLVVDKLGRRVLLLISDVFMAISTLLLGMYFTFKDRHVLDASTVKDLGWLPVLSLCVFMVVFSIGFGPIPWMIASEVAPPEIKSILSSTAGTLNWLLAFLVTRFYENLRQAMGGDGAFYLFTGFSVLGTVFVLFCVPETKGKSLQAIQDELNGVKTSSDQTGIDNQAFSS